MQMTFDLKDDLAQQLKNTFVNQRVSRYHLSKSIASSKFYVYDIN
jgi:hypothetical protein